MKRLLLMTALTLAVATGAETANPQAKSANPPPVGAGPVGKSKLISSDLGGRELQFITNALDLRLNLTFVARETTQTEHPALKAFGEEVSRTLPGQTAILDTIAEMRKVTVPTESPRQQKLSARLSNLSGAKQEKALLNAMLELNQEFVQIYEVGAKSSDPAIQQFATQSLPYVRENLARAQAMTGIAPQRSAATSRPAATPAPAKPGPKPGFRTNLAPTGGE